MIKKLFSPTCLTISILLLLYTIYKSEIYLDGNQRDYYFIYYLISGFLILFSIITFYLSEKVKTYSIITLTSIVFTLYAFEAYLTFTDYKRVAGEQLNKKIKLYKQQTGKDYDTRTRFEIYNDFKKKDKNIVVTVSPVHHFDSTSRIFPLSGISNSKTIHCNENGYYSIYKSDRYGFNNPDSEWNQQDIEYLLVGDSFTQAGCVNRPNDIGSVLRTLSKKTVLNLGYAGNGPLIEYAVLREYLKPKVKNILWLFCEGNDIGNLNRELKSEILIKYLKDLKFTQNLKFRQKQIDEIVLQVTGRYWEREKEREKERERINSFTFKLLKFVKIYNFRKKFLIKQPRPQIKELLKLAKDLAVKNNSNFYFVYLPEYSRYKFSHDNISYLSVKTTVEELNIPFIDIHKEVFLKESNPLKLFPFEMSAHYNIVSHRAIHFNIEGYRKVAEAIHKFISK